MHKNATKCNKTQSKWCINKHGASKIIDTFEMYHPLWHLKAGWWSLAVRFTMPCACSALLCPAGGRRQRRQGGETHASLKISQESQAKSLGPDLAWCSCSSCCGSALMGEPNATTLRTTASSLNKVCVQRLIYCEYHLHSRQPQIGCRPRWPTNGLLHRW
jgi:hypothetical protein